MSLPRRSPFHAAAVIGAIGVVYGDIGTSPLYAFELSVRAVGSARPDAAVVLGVLSLMFWSLLIVVTLKYIVVMLRADNHGEGGILALFALLQRRMERLMIPARYLVAVAALGAALFYCEALITPAISVMSAVEGLEVLDPAALRAVVPITLGVIVILFALQSRGTERVGWLFGPVMLLWFAVLALSGLIALAHAPQVLRAVDPRLGLLLLLGHRGVAFAVLGAVVLTLTGGEALYANMGHFGKRPIRIAWFAVVWPALILNYFGQGALVLGNPAALHKTLFSLVPIAVLPALVLLATVATIIASQSTITGAFSMTRQAIQLDLLPRLRILQTSARAAGQIYVPIVNALMFVGVCLLVIGFGSSAALGNAYGAALAGTMGITTLLAAELARSRVLAGARTRWQPWMVSALFAPLLCVDALYIISNLAKFAQGAWVPMLLALVLFGVFMTWRIGRRRLRAALQAIAVPLTRLPKLIDGQTRVPGTAVYLVSQRGFVPTAMLRNLEHNHVLHHQILFLNIEFVRTPRQDPADGVRVEELMPHIHLVTTRVGFMETPDVGATLADRALRDLRLPDSPCSFFLGWHLVMPRPRIGYMGMWMRAFAWMQRRSAQAAEFFRMPDRGVVVLATRIEI
jgi:KUP system potassium uptake protein